MFFRRKTLPLPLSRLKCAADSVFMPEICMSLLIDIHTFQMTDGDLPLKAQNLVREWLETNYEKLLEMWNTQVITKLEPLK